MTVTVDHNFFKNVNLEDNKIHVEGIIYEMFSGYLGGDEMDGEEQESERYDQRNDEFFLRIRSKNFYLIIVLI